MKQINKFKYTDLGIGVIFTLLLISLGVVFTINFRPLYYFDINFLNIDSSSGMSRQEIINNYDALIDYSSPFFQGELHLPTLPSSPAGIQHFEEVKDIFILFYILGLFTLIATIIIVIYKFKKNDYSFLWVSSVTSIVLPTLIGLLLFIDFDTTFRVFHEIFFDNDYWLFDPVTDPIIRILPDTFFLHSALLVIFIVLLGSLILYLTYRKMKNHRSIKYRKNRGLKI